MKKSARLYETDFFCWTLESAALVRAGKFDELDLEHLAEEIEDIGKRARLAVPSRMTVLLTHLLKWQFQPERRGRSWHATISRERIGLPKVFTQSPSLERYAREDLAGIYADAVRQASVETGIPRNAFPPECPYRFEQILDHDFLPEL